MTVVLGIIIGLAIRTAGAIDNRSVAGASPTTGPSALEGGRRVEMPDVSFAMTFPVDWHIEHIGEGSDGSIIILTQPQRFGSEVELQRILVAKGAGQERDTFTYCTLVRYAPIGITADEFLFEIFGQSDSLVVESLHAGLSRVLVNPWIQSRVLVDTPEAIYIEHYAIGADSAIAVLMCYGAASHRDDWLAIAESFEPLPRD